MANATIWDIEFLKKENNINKAIIKTDKYNLIIEGYGDDYAFRDYGIQYIKINKFIGKTIRNIKGFKDVKEELVYSYFDKNYNNKSYKVNRVKYSSNFIIKVYGEEDLTFHCYYITGKAGGYSYDFDAWIEIDPETHMEFLDEELKNFRQNISL